MATQRLRRFGLLVGLGLLLAATAPGLSQNA